MIVAHTAARKVFEIWGLPVTVLGATMATYSGQNYGAGKYDRITSGLKAALMLGCGWAVMVMIMAYTISTCLVGFIASTQNAEIYTGEQRICGLICCLRWYVCGS